MTETLFASLVLLYSGDCASAINPGDIWNAKNIIADDKGWKKIPDPFVERHPHPPQKNYHDQALRNASSVIVLIASFSETRTPETLRTLFQHAIVPSRVFAGVVQQNYENDADALEEFCRLLGTPLELKQQFIGRNNLHVRQDDEDQWGHTRYTPSSFAACEPAARVRMFRMSAEEAAGPLYARARQPMLLSSGSGMEDFCMQIDAHTNFMKRWDEDTLNEWALTDNEYAVLTSYPTGADQARADGELVNVN